MDSAIDDLDRDLYTVEEELGMGMGANPFAFHAEYPMNHITDMAGDIEPSEGFSASYRFGGGTDFDFGLGNEYERMMHEEEMRRVEDMNQDYMSSQGEEDDDDDEAYSVGDDIDGYDALDDMYSFPDYDLN